MSTNSQRFRNFGMLSSEVNRGGPDHQKSRHCTTVGSMTVFENYLDDQYDGVSRPSAKEQMRSLARKLGSHCFTADLGCLLQKKRKAQQDEVAKMTLFHEVDQIVPLKMGEETLRKRLSAGKGRGPGRLR
jgi:hypothetical protein